MLAWWKYASNEDKLRRIFCILDLHDEDRLSAATLGTALATILPTSSKVRVIHTNDVIIATRGLQEEVAASALALVQQMDRAKSGSVTVDDFVAWCTQLPETDLAALLKLEWPV